MKPYETKSCHCEGCAEHSAKSIVFTVALILACAFAALFITHRRVQTQIDAQEASRDR